MTHTDLKYVERRKVHLVVQIARLCRRGRDYEESHNVRREMHRGFEINENTYVMLPPCHLGYWPLHELASSIIMRIATSRKECTA